MYYTASEQTPSLCALGVLVGEDVISAGGVLIQAMPGCTDDLINQLEIRAELFGAISQALNDYTLDEIAEMYFRGLEPEILEEGELVLTCDCSRERIEKVLLSMGENQLREMAQEDHGAELTCHFCRSSYRFTEQELEELIAQGKEQA